MAHRLAPQFAADMDALSPRDANAQRLPKVSEVKTTKNVVAQLKAAKDKEHPPPPPPEVLEPASSGRPDGAVYQVGKLLGKGGFAICYSGQLQTTRQKYALKIVKRHMPPKMEQKVSRMHLYTDCPAHPVIVSNRTPNTLQDEAAEHCPIPQGLFL